MGAADQRERSVEEEGEEGEGSEVELEPEVAGVGSATRRGRAAKLKPMKPLAPSPMKTSAGDQLEKWEGEQTAPVEERKGRGMTPLVVDRALSCCVVSYRPQFMT